jgi:hypothetical protein
MLLYMCMSPALSAHCPTPRLFRCGERSKQTPINSNNLILPLSRLQQPAPVAVGKGTVIDGIDCPAERR